MCHGSGVFHLCYHIHAQDVSELVAFWDPGLLVGMLILYLCHSPLFFHLPFPYYLNSLSHFWGGGLEKG